MWRCESPIWWFQQTPFFFQDENQMNSHSKSPSEVVWKVINTILPSTQIFHGLSLLRQKPFDSLDCPLHFSLPFISDSSFFSARLIRITVVEQLKPDAKERGRKDIKWEDPRNIFLVCYWLGMGRGRIISPELCTHRHNESHIHKGNCALKLLMQTLPSRALPTI